jgi:hypothetical protein
MFRFIAKVAAKVIYRWRQEVESETNLLHAGLATRLAQEKRDLVSRLNAEADPMEARIKQFSEMEEQGYWLCEDEHEKGGALAPGPDGESRQCIECGKPAGYIKRDQMSGQEKYESDKERKEAEDIAKSKREIAISAHTKWIDQNQIFGLKEESDIYDP